MHIDWLRQEIVFKIVYYGPGLGGKTTNLEYLHAHLEPALRSRLVVLKSPEERTLYFDFFELSLGAIKGKKPRFHLYTIPGQLYYAPSRKIVLRGADAVVFVADSQSSRRQDNLDTLMDLELKLIQQQKTLARFPWVLQYNKRDLPEIETVAEMEATLNFLQVPYYEAVATRGIAVFETLRGVIQLLLKRL
ncbi:MAG TPA: GTPase domain-containing protein [bacterium]|nr:GTPase domain-containing protein [bacterium]HQG44181.1 GTPase domain-containing protein [bacterium]HQI47840.1 GTPase domain-containing protein [bacterium]HQJ64326.1 GTPase domain-containing protein [bacterium]